MDVMRGEVESMGKSHQNVAQQMKTELEEPLAAFAGAMKERRKIVQGGIEKLLKTKIQQTHVVNKVCLGLTWDIIDVLTWHRLGTSTNRNASKSRGI